MSAPTEFQLKRIAWMNFESFFDADPITGIKWHDDAPAEALESYRLYKNS